MKILQKAITEIRGAIELTDASLKRKVEEAAESQTKELSSNIMSTQSLIKDEARNLADNARSSTEQIATLVSVAGKQTDAAIAEAVERMISDAAKNQRPVKAGMMRIERIRKRPSCRSGI